MSEMYYINPYEGEIRYYAEITRKRNSILHAVSEYIKYIETNQRESIIRTEKLCEIFKEDREISSEIDHKIKAVICDMQKALTDAHILAKEIHEIASEYYR